MAIEDDRGSDGESPISSEAADLEPKKEGEEASTISTASTRSSIKPTTKRYVRKEKSTAMVVKFLIFVNWI
jgi:hypothetical protein